MRYCTKCGTKLEHTPIYQESEPNNNLELTNVCPRCSAQIPPNSKFCRKCGSPIEANETNVKYDELIEQLNYLEKLSDLKEKGVITKEEFENKKKEILKL